MVAKERFLPLFIGLVVVGWATNGFSLIDVGRYSIILLYLSAIPFFFFISSRTIAFFLLPVISTVLSAAIAFLDGVSPATVLSQTAQQVLALLFVMGVAAVDWGRYLSVLTKALSVIAVPITLLAGYQLIARPKHLKYAFLPVTNQQVYASGGLQRGWEKDHFTRASSVFVEPSDLGYFCLWLLALGLSMESGKWRLLALASALSGILFSQSLSAVLGAGIFFVVYLISNRLSVKFIRQLLIVLVLSVMAIIAIEPLMPDAYEAFYERISQAMTLDNRADSGRVDRIPAAWAIFKEAPVWGQGLGSLNSADANGSEVTSIAYALLLMERGVVGTILFLAPWLYLAVKAYRLPKDSPVRPTALFLSAMNLYCFSTFSLIYFLPFWLSLGITASLVAGTYRPRCQLMLRQCELHPVGV